MKRLVLEDDDDQIFIKEQRKLYALYSGLYISLLLQMLPGLSLQLVSAVSFLSLFLWLRYLRRQADKNTFLGAHARYLYDSLRLFFYLFIGGFISGFYALKSAVTTTELEVFTRMLLSAMMGGDTLPQAFGYISNIHPIATYSLIIFAIVLPLSYLTYRFAKGGINAHRGTTVPKPFIPFL